MRARVMIVGLGQIGMGYDLSFSSDMNICSHARAFSRHDKFSLVAGVDFEEQKRRNFEQNYHCSAYSSIEMALKSHQPDVVVLSVPTQFHGECLLQILDKSSPVIILCEKPLSYRIEEAESMLRVCNQKGIRLYVNYMRRSDPGVLEIKRRVDAHEIKQPIKGCVWYSKGFIHNGSHFFNLLEYWLGRYKSSVILNCGRSWGAEDQEPDVHVTFEHGTLLFMAAWEEAFSHYTIELLSPSGRLRYERGGEMIQWEGLQSDPYFQGYTTLSDDIEIIHSDMKRYQWNVVEQLARVLEGKEAQLCSASDALNTLKSVQHIME